MATGKNTGTPDTIKNLAKTIITDPDQVEGLPKDELLEYLSHLKRFLAEAKEFPLISIEPGERSTYLYVAGDLHGDFKTSLWISRNIVLPAVSKKKDVRVVFMGDYVDRAPDDCENGGLKNMLLLLSLKMLYPHHIYLLRGNHEAYSLLPFSPHDLPMEIMDIWGSKDFKEIYNAFEEIFSLLPLYALTSNGVFMAHGGFPKNTYDISRINLNDEDAVLQTLWGDPVETDTNRGDISKEANFNRQELNSFLRSIGAKVMLRGHDYRTLGYMMYSNTLLTVFTSRRYKDKGAGGVLMAVFSPSKDIRSIMDIGLIDISTGRKIRAYMRRFKKKQQGLGENRWER